MSYASGVADMATVGNAQTGSSSFLDSSKLYAEQSRNALQAICEILSL